MPRPLGHITSVCVDFERTLLKGKTKTFHRPEGYLSVLREIARNFDGDPTESELHQANQVLIEHDTTINPRDWELDSGSIFERVLDKLGELDCDTDEFGALFFNSFARNYVIYRDTLTGLQKLKNLGLKVGCVWDVPFGMSNDVAGVEFHHLEIEEMFDSFVLSTNVGVRRPDPGCYFELCNRLERSPRRMVYVGLYDDMLLSALHNGFQVIALSGTEALAPSPSVITVQTLDEVAAMLNRPIS